MKEEESNPILNIDKITPKANVNKPKPQPKTKHQN